jgi:hypothetical protein
LENRTKSNPIKGKKTKKGYFIDVCFGLQVEKNDGKQVTIYGASSSISFTIAS